MPVPSTRDAVTRLLVDWGHGNEHAREELVPVVYDQLRRIAHAYMRRERVDHTLQPRRSSTRRTSAWSTSGRWTGATALTS